MSVITEDRLPKEGDFVWIGEQRHLVKVVNDGQAYWCNCECGARWKVPYMNHAEKEIDFTYVGHIGYDKKAPSVVL